MEKIGDNIQEFQSDVMLVDENDMTIFKKVTNVVSGEKYVIVITGSDGKKYVVSNDGEKYQLPNDTNIIDESYAIRLALFDEKCTIINGNIIFKNSSDENKYTFLVNADAPDGAYNKCKFFSTTNPSTYIRLYASYFILSQYTNDFERLDVGDGGTTLFRSNSNGSWYLYTDGGEDAYAQASQDKKNVIAIYGVPQFEQIQIVSGEANQQQKGSGIEHLYDGEVNIDDDDHIYHSPWGGATNFSDGVQLKFELEKPSDIYQMHYYTRKGVKTNGHPGLCDIEYQKPNDETWYKVIENKGGKENAMFDFGEKIGPISKNGGYYHNVNFFTSPLKNAISVKLTFWSGSADDGAEGYISGCEVEFYGYDAIPETPDGGIQGHQGNQGEQGFQGVQGTIGNQGTQGNQGVQGSVGVQGTIGERGKDGVGVDIKGSQSECVLVGDAYIDQETGHVMIYNGTDFTDGGEIKGPQGSKGDKGDTGMQGPQGESSAGGKFSSFVIQREFERALGKESTKHVQL